MIDLSNEEWREAYRLVREAAAAPGDDAARVAAFDFLRTAESKRLLAIAHLLQPGATERSIQAALVPLERVDRRAKVTDAEMGIRTTAVPACAGRLIIANAGAVWQQKSSSAREAGGFSHRA